MRPIRFAIAGLGAVSRRIIAAVSGAAHIELVAGADTDPHALLEFETRSGRPGYDSIEALCARDDIDAVWIATPNALHAAHTKIAAAQGKHVIVEKPMALTMREADEMNLAAESAGVKLLIGHSQVSSAPIRKMRELIDSGRLGRVIQLNTWHFNDWLQRPRVASELDTRQGGGIVFRQAPHQVDTIRYLGGGMLKSVRAIAGQADPHFKTEGHYTAFAEFNDGAAATMVYNGYGHFDISELTWGIGEVPKPKAGAKVRAPEARATGAVDMEFKRLNPYVTDEMALDEKSTPSFAGLTIISCEGGVMRQSPKGIFVYDEAGCEEISCGPHSGREVTLLQSLQQALHGGADPVPDGRWGKATLEVCLAMLQSSLVRSDVILQYQTPYPGETLVHQRS